MMNWDKLLNSRRLGETASTLHQRDVRTEFDRDADRVMFSGPFRRLSRKTQVHPLAANDHVHTRLTHSLETGQVGRSLARKIHEEIKPDLPKNIGAEDLASVVRAACLAHDIGNPPFGHAGEEAMVHWFASDKFSSENLNEQQRRDIASFDGNAQGFRVLTQVENYVFKGGMRLTYATLATFLKYPWIPVRGDKKFSAFLSENHILQEVAEAVGLPESKKGYARHPLAYLVEAADDICYCVLDIEDAVEMGILRFEEAMSVIEPLISGAGEPLPGLQSEKMFRVNFARLRGTVFRLLIGAAVDTFVEEYAGIMHGIGPESLFDALPDEDRRRVFVLAAKAIGTERIYQDARKVEVELGAFTTLDVLLSELIAATLEASGSKDLSEGPLSWRSKAVLRLLGDHAPRKDNVPHPGGWSTYSCYRRAVDFVSGSTDNYATYMAKQFRGMAFTGLQRP